MWVSLVDSLTSAPWLQQALSTGYPRLLRLFHDFFAKIAVHTDTVYTLDHQSPEAVLVLRSVSVFESLYLTRSTTRMTEAINIALPSRNSLPGASEGVGVARVITNELDSARFDPLLVRTVARNAVRALDTLLSKIDSTVRTSLYRADFQLVRDFTATSLIGPAATPAQLANAQLVSCMYHCRYNLLFVQQEFPIKVWEILHPTVKVRPQCILLTLDI
jgi:hypothetical protein